MTSNNLKSIYRITPRLKGIIRWTNQNYQLGILLSQLDHAAELSGNVYTAGQNLREFQALYVKTLHISGNK